MAKKPFLKPKRKLIKNCFFCQNKAQPDYKEVEVLLRFITERKKISSREYTGVCAKHQRKLTGAIKRARHLALIPFVSQIH